jgi:glycosyltransferase involved in cell wall biosynthesis
LSFLKSGDPVKIAFATVFDLKDINRGSGTFYYMSREIERQGHIIHYVGPLRERQLPLPTRVIRGLENRAGKRYKVYLDPFYCQARASEASHVLAGLEYDILITNDFGLAGYIKTDKPVVLYTDAMIPLDYNAANIPHHSRIANLGPFGRLLFRQTIQRGVARSSLCVFPTQWIADEALKYGADPQKVRVVPFGANLQATLDEAPIRSAASFLKKGQIDLLFVGKDWARKGGSIAVKTVYRLQEQGINAILHVVGCVPPELVDKNLVKVYGFLDKSIEADRQHLANLYAMCDAFILPSSSEGYVIVVLEALAYNLPVVAYDIDGVNAAVKHGLNGYLISPEYSEEAFAKAIRSWFAQPELYDELVISTREFYKFEVNWKSSVMKLLAEIGPALNLPT